MSRLWISIALAATWLAAGAARAQSPLLPPETEPPVPRYQIELIVFAHTDGDFNEESFDTGVVPLPAPAPPPTLDSESPFISLETLAAAARDRAGRFGDSLAGRGGPRVTRPATTEPGATDAGATASGAIEQGATDPLAAIPDPFEFIDPFGRLAALAEQEPAGPYLRFLRPDELMLGDAERILDRLGAYRVLAHGGWVQDGLDEASARPIDIGAIGTTNPRGTVTLYLGRFLHVALDLLYQAPGAADVAASPAGGAAAGADGPVPGTADRLGFGAGTRGPFGFDPRRASLSELDTGRWYRLETERNAIRSGELHYIDHPLLGVLVLITPATEDDEIFEDDTAVLAPAA